MLERIEDDGTLYSYASSTILMIFALHALGVDARDSRITKAIEGLLGMRGISWNQQVTIQNSPSTIWDTALISYALQQANINMSTQSIHKANAYLLSKQQHKKGDWSIHNDDAAPGGWGFSESNSMNPDIDDTTAALRAIYYASGADEAYQTASTVGLKWVLSMQNKDGGWPAFEKGVNNHTLTWLKLDGAKAAAIDPSTADLTGRTLEYLGKYTALNHTDRHIKRGIAWLLNQQLGDGSWYGKWGICYIYGTWAAITGLKAVGMSSDHKAVKKAVKWLLSIQNIDGGWGESCNSDRQMRYIPLHASTPSQTAWALDALIAVHEKPTPEINKGIRRLMALINEDDEWSVYPTGAALPGSFYVHYHSYRYIYPLLALSHYRNKYELNSV
jgi:sporulenol synthase